MIFVLLLLIGFTTIFGLPIETSSPSHSRSNPNARPFYQLYNANQTQEIVMSDDVTNQDKLQIFVKITQNNQPEEIYSMFNRTIYVKNIADEALVDESSRKTIFKCYFLNIEANNETQSISEQVEAARSCFTNVTENQEAYMCSYLTEYLEWERDYGTIYSPPSDMFFNYYRRVEVEEITYRDDLTIAEKISEISDLLISDQNMDMNEKLFLNIYYSVLVQPMYTVHKLMKHVEDLTNLRDSFTILSNLLTTFSNGTHVANP